MIFFEPIFKQKLWGGSRISELFHQKKSNIGECWLISAHAHGDSVICSGEFKGKKLSWLYKKHRELFGNIEGKEFPLLVKLIDTREKLSIQVHPGDLYAKEKENQVNGKNECWYILEAEEASKITLGHHAKEKSDFLDCVENGKWDKLLSQRKIKKGDFYFIPSGTVHAIGEGVLILEVQQASDLTYRLYDYDRLENGKKRELHLQKAMEVIQVPHSDYCKKRLIEENEKFLKTRLIDTDYFIIDKYEIKAESIISYHKPFLLIVVIDGWGEINAHLIKKNQSFLLSARETTFKIKGRLSIIVASI